MRKIFPALILILSVGTTFPLSAQVGFYGGVRAAHATLSWDETSFDENEEKGRGPGVGVAIGYGFNPIYTMMVSLSSHNLNGGDAITRYAEIVGRFHVAGRQIQPYLEAGVMGSVFRFENDDARFSGPGVLAGAGLRAVFKERFSFEMGLRPARARFNKVKVGNQSNDIEAVKTWQMRSYVGLSVYID